MRKVAEILFEQRSRVLYICHIMKNEQIINEEILYSKLDHLKRIIEVVNNCAVKLIVVSGEIELSIRKADENSLMEINNRLESLLNEYSNIKIINKGELKNENN